ncbi:hypothetical protein ACIBEA_20225 [Streptomyces sp. NPDC051555]
MIADARVRAEDQILGLVAGTGRALAEEVCGDPLDLGGALRCQV